MIKRYIWILVILLNLFAAVSIFAEELDEASLFSEANTYYEKAQFNKAIEQYEKILQRGIKNTLVYYNLGNAYYKSGKIGKAILNYERANNLSPRDADINFNLKFAHLSTKDKIPENDGIITFIYRFTDLLTVDELTAIASVMYILLLAAIFIPLLLKKAYKKGLVIFCTFLFILSLSFIIYKNNTNTMRGIIVTPEADIRSGPDPEQTLIFTLHEGTKVEILKQKAEYYEIILPNGEKGWVQDKKLDAI